jgi:hypothetical protein
MSNTAENAYPSRTHDIGRVRLAHLFVFCVVLLCVITFWVPCCDVRYDFHIKTLFGPSLPPVVFVGGLVSYLHYLCLFAHSCVQHILCCVFVLFFFVLCTLCCQFLWIVHFYYPSIFSNVYLHCLCMNDLKS